MPTLQAGQDVLARQKSYDWKDATQKESEGSLTDELDKLLKTAPTPKDREYWSREFNGFKQLFGKFLKTKPTTVSWHDIEPPPDALIRDYDGIANANIDENPALAKELLKKLVVVKLNGGLGTSMGCKGPKSIIPVRHDLTFLDLSLQQIELLNKKYDVDVPLVLMNSFNTDEDTLNVLRKYKSVRVNVHTFNQSRWYPPGHGNFYEAFYNSGLLTQFIEKGKDYCFVSNIDNLGATVDLNILNFLLNGEEKPEFVMEVTDKTRADVKGGTLVLYQGRLMLLEIAQVPKDHVDDFKSVSKFKIFNTNNLWCNLKAAKSHVESNTLQMEIIVNPKHLDQGVDVIQLETAAGAAIQNFKNAVGINVPRSRFLPVKKTQDLLLVMSNLYDLDNGQLTLSAKRQFKSTPLIKLGNEFDKVNDFLKRIGGVPDILELDHLTVSGDVTFGKGVCLKGTVIIIANHGDRIDIPAGAHLENKIVSGNLRILDH